MEKPNGNSKTVQPIQPNNEFLTGKERKEWVNFLKLGCIGCTVGGSVDWNFVELNYNA
jgi:hypothetical protein|tara:strand:- start:285 stop:458 length:174 start_codon:yes stop_codon:yes gene_type:complete